MQENDIIVAVATGFLLATLYEIYISSTWNPWYFTHGFTLFFSEISLRSAEAALPDVSYLEARHSKGHLAQVLAFKRLDGNTIAFREKMLHLSLLHYTPIMRGVIRIDPIRRRVTVHGYMKWYLLMLTVVWFAYAVWSDDLAFTLFIIIVMGILYGIQAVRFRKVARTLGSYYNPGNTAAVRQS